MSTQPADEPQPAGAPGAAALLELQPLAPLHFRSLYNLDGGTGAIFGGQPLLQGLAAARHTAPAWQVHSITANYLRAGRPGEPVDYTVEIVRNGKRFAARRVLAVQSSKPIADILCSFHDPEEGPAHQFAAAPAVPPPTQLQSLAQFAATNAHRLSPERLRIYRHPFPVELRLVNPEQALFGNAPTPERQYWLRVASAASITNSADHQCLLALMSDYWLAGTPSATHSATASRAISVTLNHSLWFHAPARADSWLLYQTVSPWAGNGRGLVRGQMFDESGHLVASAVQEISMRGFTNAA